MAEILTVKRFKRVSFDLRGKTITFRLKRPRFIELGEISELVAGAIAAAADLRSGDLDVLSAEVVQEKVRRLYRMLDPKGVERAFNAFVDDVKGLSLEGEEGEYRTAASGADLLDAANEQLVVFVLMELHHLAQLSADEGKASASPSTSTPEEVTDASPSAAMSTGGADGTPA